MKSTLIFACLFSMSVGCVAQSEEPAAAPSLTATASIADLASRDGELSIDGVVQPASARELGRFNEIVFGSDTKAQGGYCGQEMTYCYWFNSGYCQKCLFGVTCYGWYGDEVHCW